MLVKFVGKSPSALNGFVLKPDQVYESKSGDILEVLYNKIFYEVTFEQTNASKKRKSEDQLEMETDEKKSKPEATRENKWDVIDGNKLYIFTSSGVRASNKIAAYDLDNTIIKTVSGNVFPKSIDDWQLSFSSVSKKLEQLHAAGFKIVIFTNQAGIGMGKTKIDDFKVGRLLTV